MAARYAWLSFVVALCFLSLQVLGSRELCENGRGKFDVIVSTSETDVYVIKDDRVWRLIGDKNYGFHLDRNGYPKHVTALWPGLPSGVDTAYTNYNEGRTYFFKGSQVWVYQRHVLQSGYPKYVTTVFRGLPSAIDGAFVCTGVNYFFKGNQVFSGRQGNFVGEIRHKWHGLPNNMHASVQFPSRGHTFFFKDYQFYKYRVWNGPVEAGYPKEVVPFWFQCEAPVTQAPVTQKPVTWAPVTQPPVPTPETTPDYDDTVPDGEVET